jgi:hypothetical protein
MSKFKLSEEQINRLLEIADDSELSEEQLAEKKDSCYYKVKSRYKVWPSAYASGALVKCRKAGASNWGSKSEGLEETDEEIAEKWTKKYKKSIDCSHPKGFSQKAHCAGRKKRQAGGETSSKSVSEAEFSSPEIVYHGGDKKITKLDPDSIRGGLRANLGWGTYFSSSVYKAKDYGKEITKLDISNLNILDLNDKIDETLVKDIEQIAKETMDINIHLGSMYDFIADIFKKLIGRESIWYGWRTFSNKITWDTDKLWSELILKLGYDGMQQGHYEYVIFNFEKANQYLIDDTTELNDMDEAKKTDYSKEKSQGLHGWFSRKGGGGSKGWVDCNTCKTNPSGRKTCKACGRKPGEDRKYPACRPTPGSCGTPKKGSKWGKKSNESLNESLDRMKDMINY